MGVPHGKSPVTKFGGHRHCDGRDIIFLVVKGEDSTYSCLNLPLFFISKAYRMKAHGMSYQYTSPIHVARFLGKQIMETLQNTIFPVRS